MISPIRKMLGKTNIGASELICLFPELMESYHETEIELLARKWAQAGDPTFAKVIGLNVADEEDDEDDQTGNKYTHAGTLHEPMIAAEFVRQFPSIERLHFKGSRGMVRKVALRDTQKTYRRRGAGSGMIVTPDRMIFPRPMKTQVGFEAKFTRYNTGGKHGDPDQGGIPSASTMVQIGGQMDFFDATVWFAGVCVGGVDFWFYKIERDYEMNKLINQIRDRAARFVEVLRKKNWETLTVDDSKLWRRLAFVKFPNPLEGSEMIADQELEEMWYRWRESAAVLAEAKKKYQTLKNGVELRMGPNKYVVDGMGNKMFNRFEMPEQNRKAVVLPAHCRVTICNSKNGKVKGE